MGEPYRGVALRLLEGLKRALGDRLVSLVVYGSVARGEAGPDSDLDLLIVAEGLPRSRLERQRLLMKIEEETGLASLLEELSEKGLNLELSPIIKTPEEASKLSPIYLDMVEDAVIVYDRDSFFEKVLERLRRRLRELGAERVKVGKMWYWRLKKDYRFGEVIKIE